MPTTGQNYLDNYSPKQDAYTKRRPRKRVVRIDEFDHPIPGEVRDSAELKKFFDEKTWIPYAGTGRESSHSLMLLLNNMAQTGTQKACIESIKRHCFGGRLQIVAKEDTDFSVGEQMQASEQAQREYRDWIKEYNHFYDSGGREVSIRDFVSYSFDSWKATGNVYVEIVLTETLGEKTAAFHLKKPEDCLYLNTEKGEQKYIGISPIWETQYIKKNPPRLLPAFPVYVDEGDGVMRSILHIRNGNSNWYGRPDSIGAFLYMYRELQDANYLIKLSRGNFTGLVLIETEEDNPEFEREVDQDAKENGFANYQDRLEQNFTQKGDDPSSIMHLTRPSGARAMEVEQIEPNSQHEWYTAMDEMNEKKIVMAHGWSSRLLGVSVANGLSSNVFIDELKTKQDIIASNRLRMQKLINTLLMESQRFAEVTQYSELSIQFQSPFADLAEQIENNADNDNNSMGDSEA